uniref:Uncharacterized protein n=1 Tax=Anguilla anguilla TaxID=7936 RepID=A0A0E9TX87_ANGAN
MLQPFKTTVMPRLILVCTPQFALWLSKHASS